MKAIVQNAYGSPDVLEFKEIHKPVLKDGDVLIRVQAASIHAGDYFCMRGDPWMARLAVGFPNPKNFIPGIDVAGYVEAMGKNVTRFQIGDEVWGSSKGALAEFACAAQDRVVLKPAGVTFKQAAAVPTSALAALQGIRDAGKVQLGQKVLINGASGGVGTFAVQIAKSLGAEVTGVCSTSNLEMVQSIGADHVIDYTEEDFTQAGPNYNLILDNVANHSLSDCRRALTPTGTHIPNSGNAGMGFVLKAFLQSAFVSKQGRPFVSMPKHSDMVFLNDLLKTGKLTPVIDRIFPLQETPDAMRYLEQGHAKGKVVIDLV